MSQIRPFRALRPAPGRASSVAAPPYDVLSTEEARALAEGNPDSFLRVSRPEIDLPDGIDPASAPVHARGLEALRDLVARGVLVEDDEPALYVYRQSAVLPGVGAVAQTGVVCCTSVAEYEDGAIATHEKTRPDKELDRVRHIDALGAHDEPVFLMHRPAARITELVAEVVTGTPLEDLTCDDGVRHTVWRVDADGTDQLVSAFAALPALYVADGHHRSAAAARVARLRREAGTANAGSEVFLSVVFDAADLTVLPYNRVVAGLPDSAGPDLVALAGGSFAVTAAEGPVTPSEAGTYGMFVGGRWFELRPRSAPGGADPTSRLDVAVLQDALLAPVLGVTDPRTDPRLRFVGGIRGTAELERLTEVLEPAVAFSLYPTSPFEVMDVADTGADMPPKSTWFEPKLRSGLFVHRFDDPGER